MPFDLMGLAVVLLVGLGVPVLAWRSERALASGRVTPPAFPLHAAQTLLTLGVLVALALAAARTNGLALAVGWRPSARDAVLALVPPALGLTWAPALWRARDEAERACMSPLLPGLPSERRLWTLMSLSAALCEEIAYRGVLFTLVARLVPGVWPAALAVALSYGLAHEPRGRATTAAALATGLMYQGLLIVTGSLVPAMIAHALYELGVGLRTGALARRQAAPPGDRPPDAGGEGATPPAR